MPSAGGRRLTGIAKGLFKRSLLGYRRKPVEDAFASLQAELQRREGALAERGAELDALRAELAARERRVAELDAVAYHLAERVVRRERELCHLRDQLEELLPLREELEALREREREEDESRARAQREIAELGAQARGQATRIRMQALRHAAQLAGRERAGSSGPGSSGSGAAIRIERRSAEPGGEGPSASATPDTSTSPAPAASAAVAVAEERAADNGHLEGATLERFEGLIQVEIGPLSDFSQLVRFEDAANEIGATSEISVKRFSEGRATLAMRLDRPVELLRELEERTPFEFRVRSLRDDRLILDLGEE
jgi:hypothetical protein